MRDDRVYLHHIAETIHLVTEYLADESEAESRNRFFTDLRTQDAVLRRMETLADAASHLSPSLQSRYPKVPWREIGNFRNVLAHGCTDIRLDLVWSSITVDFVHLQAVIDSELQVPSSSRT